MNSDRVNQAFRGTITLFLFNIPAGQKGVVRSEQLSDYSDVFCLVCTCLY